MNVKLYTTHCPKCKVLQSKLDASGLDYTICDDIDEIMKLGKMTVPLLQVDDIVCEFKEAVDWVNARL